MAFEKIPFDGDPLFTSAIILTDSPIRQPEKFNGLLRSGISPSKLAIGKSFLRTSNLSFLTSTISFKISGVSEFIMMLQSNYLVLCAHPKIS